jgi:hypothetical protein
MFWVNRGIELRKGGFVFGMVLIIIGVSLFFYLDNTIIWDEMWNKTQNIPNKKFWTLSVPVMYAEAVHSEYTASNEVTFYILDESNYQKVDLFLTEGEFQPYDSIYYSKGESDSYTFRAPQEDTYHVVFMGSEENDVDVSVKIDTEWVSITGGLLILSIISFILGLIVVILSFITKPKIKNKLNTQTESTSN